MKKLSCILMSAVLSVCAVRADAQEIIGIQEQIDALKEEMIFLQRKVYRDNTNADFNAPTTSTAAVKLGEYDEIVRTMNGKIDELEFKIKQLQDKFETLNKDIDIRFNLLEGKPIPAAEGALQTPQRFGAAVASGAPKSIIGDDVTSGSLKDLQPARKNLSVDNLYKNGLESLKSGNFDVAEQNFKQILDQHGSDKLAGNAQYWLGEVYYVQKDFPQAAVAFAKGYENYKDGAKGSDSLLKLGLSMAQIGKKSEACAAFVNLSSEFPQADNAIKEKARSEAKKLGCQ